MGESSEGRSGGASLGGRVAAEEAFGQFDAVAGALECYFGAASGAVRADLDLHSQRRLEGVLGRGQSVREIGMDHPWAGKAWVGLSPGVASTPLGLAH